MTWKLVKETFENAGEVAFCEITNTTKQTGALYTRSVSLFPARGVFAGRRQVQRACVSAVRVRTRADPVWWLSACTYWQRRRWL
jgi:hypothetical protein